MSIGFSVRPSVPDRTDRPHDGLAKMRAVFDLLIDEALNRLHTEAFGTSRADEVPADLRQRQRDHWLTLLGGGSADSANHPHAGRAVNPEALARGYAALSQTLLESVLGQQLVRTMQGRREEATALSQSANALVQIVMRDLGCAVAACERLCDDMRRRAEEESLLMASHRGEAFNAISRGLQELAEGNLSVRVTTRLAPEFLEMKSQFNAAAETIELGVAGLSDSARRIQSRLCEVASAADEIAAQAAAQGSDGLAQPAAALRDLAESAHELLVHTSFFGVSEEAVQKAQVVHADVFAPQGSAGVAITACGAEVVAVSDPTNWDEF